MPQWGTGPEPRTARCQTDRASGTGERARTHTHAHVHPYTNTLTHTRKHTHTQTHTHTHAHTQHTHTQTQTDARARMRSASARPRPRTHARTRARTHTNTCAPEALPLSNPAVKAMACITAEGRGTVGLVALLAPKHQNCKPLRETRRTQMCARVNCQLQCTGHRQLGCETQEGFGRVRGMT